ncbi:hypothetical protein ROHU_014534 [Labeo rohita]|uniref:Uncharacterized protein n=1 Tax=Labeo rohita TaxID=84645 RepID=A0A498LWA7_LABRO|nr:hypothetical protein ROHU_010377 [Labeo rohita]RXN34891.1 hypothetical protein ROHU_014534 [Labeo rohita]
MWSVLRVVCPQLRRVTAQVQQAACGMRSYLCGVCERPPKIAGRRACSASRKLVKVQDLRLCGKRAPTDGARTNGAAGIQLTVSGAAGGRAVPDASGGDWRRPVGDWHADTGALFG